MFLQKPSMSMKQQCEKYIVKAKLELFIQLCNRPAELSLMTTHREYYYGLVHV